MENSAISQNWHPSIGMWQPQNKVLQNPVTAQENTALDCFQTSDFLFPSDTMKELFLTIQYIFTLLKYALMNSIITLQCGFHPLNPL